MDTAHHVFDEIPERDVVSQPIMIVAFNPMSIFIMQFIFYWIVTLTGIFAIQLFCNAKGNWWMLIDFYKKKRTWSKVSHGLEKNMEQGFPCLPQVINSLFTNLYIIDLKSGVYFVLMVIVNFSSLSQYVPYCMTKEKETQK